MSGNLYNLFSERFRDHLTRTCIETDDGRRFTYGDLEEISARYARFLTELGLKPGDRVGVQVEKTAQALFFYLGCLRANLIYLPLNTAYQQTEVGFFLRDAEPRFVLCDPKAEATMRALASRQGITKVFTLDAQGQGSLLEASAGTAPDFAVPYQAATWCGRFPIRIAARSPGATPARSSPVAIREARRSSSAKLHCRSGSSK